MEEGEGEGLLEAEEVERREVCLVWMENSDEVYYHSLNCYQLHPLVAPWQQT